MLSYGSVCSGIEAATVAWHPLGWKPAFFSEIEKFPRNLLAHHYADTPCHGDFLTIKGEEYGAIDLLVGGTPCQSFSVAGLRKGMADPRGNLALGFLGLLERTRARWVVWENVPGVLSSNGGRDFGAFIGGLGQLGFGWAYRVLDAQYFGVAQRRRRVFVVGYFGDWRPAAAVLFERESLCGHLAPRRKKGTVIAALTATGVGTCGADDNQGQAGHLIQVASTGDVGHCLNAGGKGHDASEDGIGRGIPLTVSTLVSNGDAHSGFRDEHGLVPAVAPCQAAHHHAVAFQQNQLGEIRTGSVAGTLNQNSNASGRNTPLAMTSPMTVRRLTPRECERLQGFPDDYTLIPINNRVGYAVDGPRYKALGNSMAVPVMRWIGERIEQTEQKQRTVDKHIDVIKTAREQGK